MQRGMLYGQYKAANCVSEVAHQNGLPQSTVQYIIDTLLTQRGGVSKPQKGAPKKFTEREERLVLQNCRLYSKHTYAQVKSGTRLNISPYKVKQILDKAGISNWRDKEQPHLTEEVAKIRLDWALARRT